MSDHEQMIEDLKKHAMERLSHWNADTINLFKAADVESNEYLPFMASLLFKAFSAIVAMIDVDQRSLWEMMRSDLREMRADYAKFIKEREGNMS